MKVAESFLLEAFPLVSCPNLTSLLCSFHPTTDYSAPPWFHLPCVYWLRCSPFARFGKSEGFGSYGSLVCVDSVRLWASLFLSLFPLYGFFSPPSQYDDTLGLLPRVLCCICTCRPPPLWKDEVWYKKKGRDRSFSSIEDAWEPLEDSQTIGNKVLWAEPQLELCSPNVWREPGSAGAVGVFVSSWDRETGKTHPRAVRTSDCTKASRIIYLYYHFRCHNKTKCEEKKQSENFHRLYLCCSE